MNNKFSLDNKYELDDAKKNIDNLGKDLKVRILISDDDDYKPEMEMLGTITKEEVLEIIRNRKNALHSFNQKDELTGVLNQAYFEKRMGTIDRSQVLPVAVVNININDWKFVNDNFGDEESDRLIKTIAQIILGEAKPYFVVGRIDGDVFGVVIPMAVDGEAEFFVEAVKGKCDNYADSILAPSVAVGIAYKTNIEQKLEDLLSDAEYEMFQDKYITKNSDGYRERLEHGLS